MFFDVTMSNVLVDALMVLGRFVLGFGPRGGVSNDAHQTVSMDLFARRGDRGRARNGFQQSL